MQQKIITNLWFDTESEEAAKYYVSIFKDGEITKVTHFTEAGPREAGMVLTVTFKLFGQEFVAINGGPEFKFSEAISLAVMCDTQEEIDNLWEKLSEGGSKDMCGWLKDKYGLSWQIVPRVLEEMVSDSDPAKVNSVMEAMLQMQKLDIAKLQEAYDKAASPA